LSFNILTDTLPSAVGNLTQLVHLDLSYNRLTDAAVPDAIYTLESLQSLYLSDNQITR
jgi:Leucine-rich repeat (LRR) protein